MFRFGRLRTRLLSHSRMAALIFLSIGFAFGGTGSPSSTTCLRIDSVGEPPGIWSGQFATEQWLEATVIKTSQKDLEVGQHVRFGIYVVHGDRLMDKSNPRLNPALIHPGTRVTISGQCVPLKKDGVTYDPHCVRVGCTISKPSR